MLQMAEREPEATGGTRGSCLGSQAILLGLTEEITLVEAAEFN
jgi:hypothetical protein